MKKIHVAKSGIEGFGLFVSENVRRGELIHYIKGNRVKKIPKNIDESLSIPNWYGVSKHYWIDPGETPFRYLNHSCDPNSAITGTKSLMPLRDIQANEELTIDYSMTDPDPLWEMRCECKAPNCRKKIRSIHDVPTDAFISHMPLIPKYFQRMYIRNYIKNKLESEEGTKQ